VELETPQRAEDDQRQPEVEINQFEYVQEGSAAAARTDTISVMDQGPEARMARRSSRRAPMTACVLGLVLVGSVGVWLADTHRTLVPPSTKVAADPIEEADIAYRNGDYATALRLIRPLADQGNAISQTFLGAMYANGEGVPQNDGEAAKWYRLAADKRNAAAQNLLGSMYFSGKGVPQNHAEASKWYRLAADKGNAAAQNSLGSMYANGEGVPQNDTEAVRWPPPRSGPGQCLRPEQSGDRVLEQPRRAAQLF
jgi:TPR repeat protein